MGERCEQFAGDEQCRGVAVARCAWPGSKVRAICPSCLPLAHKVATVMGFTLQVAPIIEPSVEEKAAAALSFLDIPTAAGYRALRWWLDTGDCFFCRYEGAHEDHCTFHPFNGMPGESVEALCSKGESR